MYEEFNNAKHKNIISDEEFSKFDEIFKEFKKVKGSEKSKQTSKAKELYKRMLYPRLKEIYNNSD